MRLRIGLAHTGHCPAGAGGARCAPPAPAGFAAPRRGRALPRAGAELGAPARATALAGGGTCRLALARPAAELLPTAASGARRLKGGARRMAPALATDQPSLVQTAGAALLAILVGYQP
jgi:hypothetical protein